MAKYYYLKSFVFYPINKIIIGVAISINNMYCCCVSYLVLVKNFLQTTINKTKSIFLFIIKILVTISVLYLLGSAVFNPAVSLSSWTVIPGSTLAEGGWCDSVMSGAKKTWAWSTATPTNMCVTAVGVTSVVIICLYPAAAYGVCSYVVTNASSFFSDPYVSAVAAPLLAKVIHQAEAKHVLEPELVMAAVAQQLYLQDNSIEMLFALCFMILMLNVAVLLILMIVGLISKYRARKADM